MHPSSHSQPAIHEPDADSHSAVDIVDDSQQPEELERFVDRASSLSRQDKRTDLLAATETEKRSNLSLAGGKRSVVDETDLAVIPTPDELMADPKEQEPQVPPAQKKQRKGSSSSCEYPRSIFYSIDVYWLVAVTDALVVTTLHRSRLSRLKRFPHTNVY